MKKASEPNKSISEAWKVKHLEIPADDMARVKKFYSSLFGWKIQGVPGME